MEEGKRSKIRKRDKIEIPKITHCTTLSLFWQHWYYESTWRFIQSWFRIWYKTPLLSCRRSILLYNWWCWNVMWTIIIEVLKVCDANGSRNSGFCVSEMHWEVSKVDVLIAQSVVQLSQGSHHGGFTQRKSGENGLPIHLCWSRLFWTNRSKYMKKALKGWVCVFTCLSTRAIHLEMVYSLDTDSCLSAITRLIAPTWSSPLLFGVTMGRTSLVRTTS